MGIFSIVDRGLIVRCPFYFNGICIIRKALRNCKGQYNLLSLFTEPSEGCGAYKDDTTGIGEDEEEYRCKACNRIISKEEYEEFDGLCRWCRGAPTQKGFPSPPGFPKTF